MPPQEPVRSRWDQLGSRETPSWYLDRLVALQKRDQHQNLIRRWTRGVLPRSILKTDVFEEAHGSDQVLFDLFDEPIFTVGMDVAFATAARARRRCSSAGIHFLAADVRRLPLGDGAIDLVISPSTLDHFDTAEEFETSLRELARVIAPGGALIITLDNAYNPTYYPLRWVSRLRSSPFPLGYTPTLGGLEALLAHLGLEVTRREYLIHNPRLFSSAIFVALRRLLGSWADRPIAGLLWLFALLDRLPSRWITGCFVAVRAEKPIAPRPRAREESSHHGKQ